MNFSALNLRCRPFLCLLALSLLAAWTQAAYAEPEGDIVRVEEDWELVVGTPAPESLAPQVSSVISPQGNIDGLHAAMELNVQSLLDFLAGGIQLQVWHGETPLNDRKFPSFAVLSHPNETITWTQSMEIADGMLTFEITDGSSLTWGNFGGQGYLKAAIGTQLTNLNSYNPAVSAANSGVSYAANRVQSLTLKAVRVYYATGEQAEYSTAVTVYPTE